MTEAAIEPRDRAVVPLRSDPPWLARGLLGVTLGSLALFMLYFRTRTEPRVSVLLAIIPGLAVATFVSAWLAWWARVRGGALQLEAAPTKLVLHEPRGDEQIVDRGRPYGAMLVQDRHNGQRVLVLSQNAEPVLVLDRSRASAAGGTWAARAVQLDLGSVAISPASAHVVTVGSRARVETLMNALESDLSPTQPYLLYRLPSGEVLQLDAAGLRLGDRTAAIKSDTVARRIAIQTPEGTVTGLSILAGDTSFLLACQDPSETLNAGNASDVPDAYLPSVVWAAVAVLYGVEPGGGSTLAMPYRG